jgi:hypothetical protein
MLWDSDEYGYACMTTLDQRYAATVPTLRIYSLFKLNRLLAVVRRARRAERIFSEQLMHVASIRRQQCSFDKAARFVPIYGIYAILIALPQCTAVSFTTVDKVHLMVRRTCAIACRLVCVQRLQQRHAVFCCSLTAPAADKL